MTYDPVDANDDGTVEADVDNQSVSTVRASSDVYRSENDSAPGEQGSDYSTGGDGSGGNPYTGDALRAAVDAVQANGHSAAPKTVHVDGRFDESLSLPSPNGLVLDGKSWNAQISPSSGYGVDIGDGSDAQVDVKIEDLTIRDGGQKSANINHADEVQFFKTHLNNGLDAVQSENVWIDNSEVTNKNMVLKGCSEWEISNFLVHQNTNIQFTDDSGTYCSDMTLGTVRLLGGSAVEVLGGTKITGGPIIMEGGFNNLFIDNGASDSVFFVDSKTDRNDAVNIANGTNITVIGAGDNSGGGNASIEFQSNATECVASGNWAGWINNGTRCLVNGRGVNSGDPNSTGGWNGHTSYAEDQNATIHDTANDNLYMARNGAWSQVGS